MEKDEGYKRLGKRALYLFIFLNCGPTLIFLLAEILLLIFSFNINIVLDYFRDNSLVPVLPKVISWGLLIMPIVFIVTLALGLGLAFFRYYTFRYRMEDNGVSFRRGIFSNEETSMPFKQIQNVDIDQSILYRILGMANVIIMTAGQEDKDTTPAIHSEVEIPALSFSEAERIQQFLLNRSNIQEVIPAPGGTEVAKF